MVNTARKSIKKHILNHLAETEKRQNAKVAKESAAPSDPPGCNCRGGPPTCPLNGACQTKEVVYKATVTRLDNNQVETYTGLTGATFKTRYNKHMSDFRNQAYSDSTTLSKYIWDLKNQNTPHNVSWQILSKARGFNPVTKTCQLCLREKFFIMCHPLSATLNSRKELFNTCRHRLKPLLRNYKT